MRISKDTLVVLHCESQDNAATDALSRVLLLEFLGAKATYCFATPKYFRVFGTKDFEGKVYFREN